MGKSLSHTSKTLIRRWHIDSCDLNNITWGTLSGDWTSCNYLDGSWNMTNWNLIRWLLDFNILVTHKFTLLDLEDKISLNLIFHTFLTWAFDLWCKLLSVDALIDLESTCIASVDSYLHAWFDITASGDNTFDRDKSSNRMSFDFPHLYESLLFQSTSWDNLEVVVSLEFGRNSHL